MKKTNLFPFEVKFIFLTEDTEKKKTQNGILK